MTQEEETPEAQASRTLEEAEVEVAIINDADGEHVAIIAPAHLLTAGGQANGLKFTPEVAQAVRIALASAPPTRDELAAKFAELRLQPLLRRVYDPPIDKKDGDHVEERDDGGVYVNGERRASWRYA